jgi:hypothetical protein
VLGLLAAVLLIAVAQSHLVGRPAPLWLARLAGGVCLLCAGLGAAFAGLSPELGELAATYKMAAFFLACAAGAAATGVWLAIAPPTAAPPGAAP